MMRWFSFLSASKLNVAALALLVCLASNVAAGDFEIDWWTIDNGGSLDSQQGEWTLAGTFGQWDASVEGAANGQWFLNGGFWAFEGALRQDVLFGDRFEMSPSRGYEERVIEDL